jgi:hypothetical protein
MMELTLWQEGMVLCMYWLNELVAEYMNDSSNKVVERLLDTVRNARITKPTRIAALFLLVEKPAQGADNRRIFDAAQTLIDGLTDDEMVKVYPTLLKIFEQIDVEHKLYKNMLTILKKKLVSTDFANRSDAIDLLLILGPRLSTEDMLSISLRLLSDPNPRVGL